MAHETHAMAAPHMESVRAWHPRATASSDYTHEACWTHIFDDHDDDGVGQGDILGVGLSAETAWVDASKKLFLKASDEWLECQRCADQSDSATERQRARARALEIEQWDKNAPWEYNGDDQAVPRVGVASS